MRRPARKSVRRPRPLLPQRCRAGDGHELMKVPDGLVVRPTAAPAAREGAPAEAPALTNAPLPQATGRAQPTTLGAAVTRGTGTSDVLPASGLAGEPIDKEWTAFALESGTKGVPRAETPQVKADDRSALVQFLRARHRLHAGPRDSRSRPQADASRVRAGQGREGQGVRRRRPLHPRTGTPHR